MTTIRSSSWIRGASCALGLVVLLPAGRAHAQDPYRWSGTLADGQRLDVRAISGDVHAVPASGSTALVTATKRGNPADFGEVEIRTVEEGNRIVTCVIYGSRNFDREGCDQDWSDDDRDRRNRSGRRDNIDVSVDFEVQVPTGVDLRAASVSGDVVVDDVRSSVHASSVSGDVRVSATGVVEASSVSGELDIAMGSLDWDDLEFNTVSGDIILRLPANVGADVRFRSVSGDFRSDFDLRNEDRERGQWVGMDVSGTIGAGGRRLSLRTVSGDVDIRTNR